MKVGSLFTGVGGFDIAAERAGMRIAWQSEIDKRASEVLREHWPEVPNYGDIHKVTFNSEHIGATHVAPAVDVLVGGFPCQDYSVAGLRGGLAGDRGALWWEFHRLIAEGHPRWVVGENVPGLLSSRGGEDFATIIDSLTELGYRVAWRVLDAQYFGVAQRRRRVFIVGHSGKRSASKVLALAEGLSGHPAPRRGEGEVVTQALTGGPGSSSAGNPDDNRAQGNFVIPVPPPSRHAGVTGRADSAVAYDELNDSLSPTHHTLRAGTKQSTGVITGMQVRRLTPTETELLQGFSGKWTQSQTDTQRYRQMGNAVAVPVAEWIFKQITKEERNG